MGRGFGFRGLHYVKFDYIVLEGFSTSWVLLRGFYSHGNNIQ